MTRTPGEKTHYFADDNKTYPGMLDNRNWPKGARVVMRGIRRMG